MSVSIDTSSGGNIELVVFELAGKKYALPVGTTNSVIEPKGTTRVPRSGDSVEGIMDYRGEVAVIIDLTSILGVEVDEYKEKNIIILDDDVDNQTVGVVSDVVTGVNSFNIDNIETNISDIEENNVPDSLINGVYTGGDEVIEVIDVEEVLQQIIEETRLEFGSRN